MGRGELIDELLKTAAIEGMERAIQRHGATFTPVEIHALRTLTQTEIRQLSTLRAKLSPLKRVAADNVNNGGIF